MITSLVKEKTLLTTENVACKGENAITEGKRLYQSKVSLANAKNCFPSENVARKGEKGCYQRQKRYCRVKTSLSPWLKRIKGAQA